MSSNNGRTMMGASRRFAICVVGLLSVFATRASAQHVHQLLYNNSNWTDQNLVGAFHGSSWSNQDVTATTHAGNAVDYEGMSGLSLGNYQYVYYVGK